jgi:hypothetical protein
MAMAHMTVGLAEGTLPAYQNGVSVATRVEQCLRATAAAIACIGVGVPFPEYEGAGHDLERARPSSQATVHRRSLPTVKDRPRAERR